MCMGVHARTHPEKESWNRLKNIENMKGRTQYEEKHLIGNNEEKYVTIETPDESAEAQDPSFLWAESPPLLKLQLTEPPTNLFSASLSTIRGNQNRISTSHHLHTRISIARISAIEQSYITGLQIISYWLERELLFHLLICNVSYAGSWNNFQKTWKETFIKCKKTFFSPYSLKSINHSFIMKCWAPMLSLQPVIDKNKRTFEGTGQYYESEKSEGGPGGRGHAGLLCWT